MTEKPDPHEPQTGRSSEADRERRAQTDTASGARPGRQAHTPRTDGSPEDPHRKRYLERQVRLVHASLRILEQKDHHGLLEVIAESARELTGAKLGSSGHGYRDGRFVTGAASRAPDIPPYPQEAAFDLERGAVFEELLEGAASLRLTDDEMRRHPRWWGLPDDHVTLDGLLAARLVGRDGEARGMIFVSHKEVGEFDEEDEAALSQLAALASLALQQVDTRAALEHARDDLERQVRERTAEITRRAEDLARLASELTLTEQRERRRLAVELHDNLQQLLVGTRFGLEALANRIGDEHRESIGHLAELVDESIKASRSLTVALSPPVLFEGGLGAGLEWLGRWMGRQHGLEVEVFTDPEAVSEREDVRVLLYQAVRELLLNVVKHARTNRARVELERLDRGFLEVTVEDLGVGFDPEALRPGGAGSGGGFGLFGIRERFSLLGGSVEVGSSPGEGTRIVLTAPGSQERPPYPGVAAAGNAAAAPAADAPVEDAAPGTVALRVLLADDHVVMRHGLSTLLEGEPDIEVVGEASDGREAVQLAHRLQPDVILMDLSMPVMNGVEATRVISRELPAIRVIGLSMYEEADREAAIREAGASDYVVKSDPPAALLAAIRNTAN